MSAPSVGGHYIAVRGYDSKGWLVDDPNGDLDLIRGASLSRGDPVALVHSSHLALTRQLCTHRGQPIRRLWIDHPYGEEEITLLEEDLIPAMDQFLARIEEIDAAPEAAHEAEIEQVQAAMATEALAAA